VGRLAAALGLAACGKAPSYERPDPHSQAESDRVAVRHLALDLSVDFATKRLSGTAKLTVTRIDRSAPLVLDSEQLALSAVTDCTTHAPLTYTTDPLRIQLASDCVEIAYRTSPEASAMLWVDPAGTAGGTKPMLFTQSQAVHARSWIPLQDSPSVRFTYEATIHPPPGLWALMSADNPQRPPADGVWRFAQKHPIPSYLMALAVGELAFRPIGPRSGVYAEPAVVEAAAREFDEVEAMMAAAEELHGP